MRTLNYLHARSRQGEKVPMPVSEGSDQRTFNIIKQALRVTIGRSHPGRDMCYRFPLSTTCMVRDNLGAQNFEQQPNSRDFVIELGEGGGT